MVLSFRPDLIRMLPLNRFMLPDGTHISELLAFFGYNLLLFIGVELLDAFKSYEQETPINALVVFLVAVIAISTGVITL